MNIFRRFWTSIVRYVRALEGVDDPVGEYMFSLGRRVDKLERDMARLESQSHPPSGGELQL